MADPKNLKARENTYIATDSDWINFEATVSTSADQIAIAPGYLQKNGQKMVDAISIIKWIKKCLISMPLIRGDMKLRRKSITELITKSTIIKGTNTTLIE